MLQGKWCPKCRNTKEQYCREIFEYLFKKDFPNTRPDWLRNEAGNKLELDGYNRELQLAFEYNGMQHYETVEYFGMSEERLSQQQEHDSIKIEQCLKKKIILIIIPYTLKTKKKIREFIYRELFDWFLDEYSDNDLPPELLVE